MKIEIIELTSAETVVVRAPHVPEFVAIRTLEEVVIGPSDYGIIEGKLSNAQRGILCNSGIVHPGFRGTLTPFLTIWGNALIPKGMQVAHLMIFRMENSE